MLTVPVGGDAAFAVAAINIGRTSVPPSAFVTLSLRASSSTGVPVPSTLHL